MTTEIITKLHVAYIGGTRYVADPDRDCCYWADPDRDGSIDEDRATLFAAAPELLKELETLLGLIDHEDIIIPRSNAADVEIDVERARAAIAAAK